MIDKKAHIITVSNEKGGTGKSTVSMHLAVTLMQEKFKVAVIDMDGRQGTLSRYVENRINFAKQNNINLIIPQLVTITPRVNSNEYDSHSCEINMLVEERSKTCDAIVVDSRWSGEYVF